MRSSRLVVVMMTLLIISILISLFSIYTIYDNRQELLQSVERNVRSELARYDIATSDDIKIDDARILLAVAQYCETRGECKGQTGLNGSQGVQGIQGIIGLTGVRGSDGVDGDDGYTPIKGVDYFDGEKGESGNDGRKIIQRCNPDKDRIEWQYEGDENWQPLYNLSPLQTCTMEE